jgi:hypothetical protein
MFLHHWVKRCKKIGRPDSSVLESNALKCNSTIIRTFLGFGREFIGVGLAFPIVMESVVVSTRILSVDWTLLGLTTYGIFADDS